MRAPAIATLIVGVCVAGRAECQTPEVPTPQGSAIFGGADARGLAGRDERLDLILQLFGGYDDDVLADQSGAAPRQERLVSAAAGLATGIGASLLYSRPGLLFRRPGADGDFRAWADSSLRYYPGLDDLTGTYHRAGLQVSAPLTRRLTVYASPRMDYSPRYSFQLLAAPLRTDPEASQPAPASDDTSSPDIDYSVVSNNSFRYGAIGGAQVVVGTRSTFSLDAGYTRRTSDIERFDMEVRNAGVSFDHQFTKTASLELGYGYQDGNHGSGLTTKAHNIDIGIDYRRPLSRTRKTFVAFNTGSTVTESEVSGRRVHAIGAASLVHYMKRTWTAHVEYRRRLQYVDGFDRPLFGDGVTTGFNGMLSRRMELVVRGNYTSGTVGLSPQAPRFESVFASARLRKAMSRRLAGYVEGLFYHYEFQEDALRPPGLPPSFDRFALRCGLSLWVPLTH
jgi:hypothetical protein